MPRFRATGRERPSKPVAVVILVGTIGIVVTVVAFLTVPEVGIVLFGILFVGAIVWNLAYAGSNIAGQKPIHHTDGEYEGSVDSGCRSETSPDFAERLRKLEELKKDGLLSEEEYHRKREEILSERW